jgi:hypothetical protein
VLVPTAPVCCGTEDVPVDTGCDDTGDASVGVGCDTGGTVVDAGCVTTGVVDTGCVTTGVEYEPDCVFGGSEVRAGAFDLHALDSKTAQIKTEINKKFFILLLLVKSTLKYIKSK